MPDSQTLLPSVNYTPQQINTFMNYVFWAIIALLVVVVLGIIIWKVWQRMKYTLAVNLHRQVGDTIIVEQQMARKLYTGDGRYVYHFIPMNKKSPVFEDKFNKLIKRPALFGLRQNTYIGFDAYLKDGKIIPMDTNKKYLPDGGILNVSLTGIDYDMTNFIKIEIDDYYQKKQRVSALMQLLPYLTFLILVIAWIVGMMLYTKHVEALTKDILQFGQNTVSNIVEKIGTIQVFPQK